MEGWIKIHRQILGSAIFENPNLLKVWIWCLCKATHKPREQMVGLKLVPLEAGQFVTGRKAAAKELGVTESSFYKYIKTLESVGMVSLKSNNKFTVVTIEKWALYQSDNSESDSKVTAEEQQSNNKGTTKEQQSNTNKNVKNDKNVKNVKKIYIEPPELNDAILSFIEFRKKIKKPMTDKAINLLIGKLKKLSSNTAEQIEILEQSIMNGWTSIYPLKEKEEKGDKGNAGTQRNTAEQQPQYRMGIYV